MNQFPARDFPLNSGGRNTSEDPLQLHSGLLNWLCEATLIGGGGGFASSRNSGKMIEKGEEESLSKLLGLPLTETHLQDVLSATCKHVINNLRRSGKHGPEGVVGLSRPMINQAFRRVFRFLYGEEAPREDDITIVIQKISTKSSDLNGVINQVVLLGLMWIACCLLQRWSVELQLGCIEQIVETNNESQRHSRVQAQDSTHHRQQTATENTGFKMQLRGIISYLRVCSLVQAEEWVKCVEIINKELHSIPDQLQDQVQYIRAFCLYHHGNFTEALDACQRLTEIISKDGVSVQVYNLMGCCLRQMGKPHMAQQQFRKALTSCSIIPPPSLFNLSVTYRDLGDEDAEVKSLRLLVKALALDQTADENGDDTFISPSPAWPPVLLLPVSWTKERSDHPMQSFDYWTGVYVLAKRSHDLNQTDIAVDMFMALLSDVVLLESSSLAFDGSSRGNSLLPPLKTIYLDAATALLKAGKTQEALAVCDKLLSKSSLLQHDSIPDSSSQMDDGETKRSSRRFPFLVPCATLSPEERSKAERTAHPGGQGGGDGSDGSIPRCSSGSGGRQTLGQGSDVGHHGTDMQGLRGSGDTVGRRKRQREQDETLAVTGASSTTLENQVHIDW